MDVQAIVALVFVFIFSIFLILKRKNVKVQKIISYLLYVVMFRGKFGLKRMDSVAKKYPKTIKVFGYIGIGLGYIGILVIAFTLIKALIDQFLVPGAAPAVMPVLPIKAKGIFYVPPLYFIISIFVLATVHEFSHGLLARRYNIPVKASGFGFVGILLPVLPLAFVEPDEKRLKKAKPLEQLSVYAAGPTANIFLALVLAGIFLLATPALSEAMVLNEGVKIVGVTQNLSAYYAGIREDELILSVDDVDVETRDNFTQLMLAKSPGDSINIITDKDSYEFTLGENPEDPEKAYLGVYVQESVVIRESFRERYGTYTPDILIWILGLVTWLIMLNLGVGLFNFIPLGPIDGGRILLLTLEQWFKKKTAFDIWRVVSTVFLLLLLSNLAFLFIK